MFRGPHPVHELIQLGCAMQGFGTAFALVTVSCQYLKTPVMQNITFHQTLYFNKFWPARLTNWIVHTLISMSLVVKLLVEPWRVVEGAACV